MATRVKRLLAVSWAMPPMLFPRSIQVSRVLSALSKSGWRSTVICNDPQQVTGNDATLSELYDADYEKINVPADPSKPSDALMHQWLEPALQSARAQLKSQEYSAFITFAQPWVDHLIGLEIQKEIGIPWIAHFSDPWVDSPYYSGTDAKQLEEWKNLEREAIDKSSAVIFTNSQALDLVMGKYPIHWKRKSYVVPHSFDAELAQKLKKEHSSKDGRLHMVYTGDLYGERSAVSLLKALSVLSKQRPLADELNVQLIGRSTANERRMVKEMALGNVVDFRDQYPYVKSLEACAACDILLLIDAPGSQPSPFLPSKLVDYLMFRKPVLGLTTSKGASADLLQRLGNVIVPPDDVPSIIKVLDTLLNQWHIGSLKPADNFDDMASAYNMQNVGLSLDQILCDVIEAAPSKSPVRN